jgi:hypothetical protein
LGNFRTSQWPEPQPQLQPADAGELEAINELVVEAQDRDLHDDKIASHGLTYPHDWGFVPSIKADDGDPLDVMVIHDAATFPGIVLACRIIGILQLEQKSKGNRAKRSLVRSAQAFALGARFARRTRPLAVNPAGA